VKFVRIILLAAVILILQLKVVPEVRIGGIAPDLMMVLLIALVLEREPVMAVIIGFALGFLQDLGNASFLGMNALAKSLVAYGVSRFGAGFLPESVLFKGLLIVAACLFNDVVVLIVTNGFDLLGIIASFFRYSLLSALYTAAVGVCVYVVVDLMTGRVVGARGGR
jgi:rod shape-determining protein MreD